MTRPGDRSRVYGIMPRMPVLVPPPESRLGGWTWRAALVVLVALSAVAAHYTAYLARFGPGARFLQAMEDTGHDGYWAPMMVLVLASAGGLVLAAAVRLRQLGARARDVASTGESEGVGAYLLIVAGLWARLGLLTALVFAVQEDLERIVVGEPLLGLEALAAHGWLPLAALVAASLVVATVAGLFLWRRLVLLARLANAPTGGFVRPAQGPRQARDHELSAAVVVGGGGIRAPPRLALPA